MESLCVFLGSSVGNRKIYSESAKDLATSIIKNGYNGFILKNEGIDELAKLLSLAMQKSCDITQNCVDSIKNFSTLCLLIPT